MSLTTEQEKEYTELENKLNKISDKLQNPKIRSDHETMNELLDEFMTLSDEQEKIKPYGFIKKKKKNGIKTMRTVINEALELKTKNKARYQRLKNEITIKLGNIAKRFKHEKEKQR